MADSTTPSTSLPYTAAEEFANTVTHGIGLALSFAGLLWLLFLALQTGSLIHISGSAVFGVTLVLMYTASTLYHSASSTRMKHLLRILDHIAIYLLIAGTYTPFLLVHFGDTLGWTLLMLVWGCALAGSVFKLFFTGQYGKLSASLYVAMGWLVVVAGPSVLEAIPPGCLEWLLAGGLFYTVGVIFFAWHRLPYNHAIWHLFVLAGSFCHYVAVVQYIIP